MFKPDKSTLSLDTLQYHSEKESHHKNLKAMKLPGNLISAGIKKKASINTLQSGWQELLGEYLRGYQTP